MYGDFRSCKYLHTFVCIQTLLKSAVVRALYDMYIVSPNSRFCKYTPYFLSRSLFSWLSLRDMEQLQIQCEALVNKCKQEVRP